MTERPRSIASGIGTVDSLTVTTHSALKLPSSVVTVIVAVPGLTPLTKPDDETVATEVLDEDQVTVLSAASLGVTVAVRF